MGYQFFSLALARLLEHMHKKFEINRTKIKVGCQLGRKVVPHDSKSDLPLVTTKIVDFLLIVTFLAIPKFARTPSRILGYHFSS